MRIPCQPAQSLPFVERAPTGHAPEAASQRGIAFGVEPLPGIPHESGIPIPGYNAPGLALKPVRDAELSLIALGRIAPSTPVMVEVPLVQDSTVYMTPQTLAGSRIGFAQQYQRGSGFEAIEHSVAFLRVLKLLGQAGAQMVPVSAQHWDAMFHFDVQSHNEIDDLVVRHRLDALVAEGDRGAFHGACESGYPSHCEILEQGVKLWIYGSRGTHLRLGVLAQTCQRLFTQSSMVKPTFSS